jgi:diguanylate cyclase (GGDEF)-like protein
MHDAPNDSESIAERLEAARELGSGTQESGIFDDVDFPSVAYLLERCAIRELAPGTVLLRSGERNRTLYYVLSGNLSVHLESADAEPFDFSGPGHALGELSVIDGNLTTAFVVAKTPVTVLTMEEETFWNLVNASHAFAMNLILFMARRMRHANVTVSIGIDLRKRFEHDAMFDALTSLHNRRWFDANFPRFLQRHQMDGKPLSVFMLDIDHFKKFNDAYGHAAGDLVLSEVAATMQAQLRPTDSCARMGGEEFLVILPDTDAAGAVVAADRLRKAIRDTALALSDGKPLPALTVSIGVAQAGAEEKASDMVSRADAALYRAKNGGRDRVER